MLTEILLFMLQSFVANKARIGEYDGERRKDYKIFVDESAGQNVVEVASG
jgi:hypothetical protein